MYMLVCVLRLINMSSLGLVGFAADWKKDHGAYTHSYTHNIIYTK